MNVDLDLKYSWDPIQKTLLDDIKKIDRDGGILDMEPFPSPHTLALLAKAVYSDKYVDLPKGWQIVTIARNSCMTNGYVGAAYLNPSLQQVVISHRGTKLTNLGAILTDCKGVLNSGYTSQMNSAVTFADKIMAVLCEVNKEKGYSLQLSVTGHSLGGWLAQVTAFTLKNVRREDDSFTKIQDCSPVRHVHTVTFDTPGCRNMLEKIIDHGYYRYSKTVSLDELDITNYLGPPNRINTTGSHVGMVHLVDLDLSNFSYLSKHTAKYNIDTHKINNFVKAFENNPAIHEVLDWPKSHGLLGVSEYNALQARVSYKTNYEYTPERDEKEWNKWRLEIRYKKKTVDYSRDLRIFSKREIHLIKLWCILKAENVKMTEVSAYVEKLGLKTDEKFIVGNLFADFDIAYRTETCQDKERWQRVVRHTKQLTRWFPGLLEAMKRQISEMPRAGELMYRMEARNYFASLPKYCMCFEDTIKLKAFLESDKTRILYIATEDSRFQVSVVYNLLSQMSQTKHLNTFFQCDNQTFVDWKIMQDLEKAVDFINLYKSGYTYDDLLVIDLPVTSQDTRFFKQFLGNVNKKLIIISSRQSEHIVRSLGVPLSTAHREQFGYDDLTEDSKTKLFTRKMFISGGKPFALEVYTKIQHLGKLLLHITQYTDRNEFKKIMTDENYTIEMEDARLSDDLNVHSTVKKEVSMKRVARVLSGSDALLVVSGIGREALETDPWKQLVRGPAERSEENDVIPAEDGEAVFKEKCREKPHATIYWFSVSAGLVRCNTIYKKEFYIKRKFEVSTYIFDSVKFVSRKIVDDEINQRALFVVQNVNREQSRKLHNHILTAASEREADDIIRKNPNRPVHVLKQGAKGGPIVWQRSRGSLEGLRPYVTADTAESVDEKNLRDKKTIIIADDPGMGKSTTLTSVARLLGTAWVVRVDLKDFPLDNLPRNLCLNLVCKFILRDQNDWLRGLLQFCLDKDHEHSRDVYICFDGFDEIRRNPSRNAEDEALRLLEYLNNETKARVWVTTRLYRAEKLENALSVFATRFERIAESEQRLFLVNFWRPHLLLETDNFGHPEERKLGKCAEHIYGKAKKVLGDDIQQFMGIPLQVRMLAEICLPLVKSYIESETDIQNIFDVSSVTNLYQQFVQRKYDIYLSDKTGLDERMSETLQQSIIELITEKHRMLGLRTLFPEFAEKHFDNPEDGWGTELCRVGLVQAGGGGRAGVEYTHRTLAEFYCADLVVEWLRRRGRYHGHAPVVELLLTEILSHKSNHVSRKFINNFLLSESLSEEADKFNSVKMSKLWLKKQNSLFNEDTQTALHVAVEEGSAGIVELLLGGFRCAPERLVGFLAAHDEDRHTALGRAAQTGCEDIMRKIVGSVERCTYDVILEVLLATYAGHSSCYVQKTADGTDIKKAFTRTQEVVNKHLPALIEAVKLGDTAQVGSVCRRLASGTEMLYCLLGADGAAGADTALHHLTRAQRGARDTILAHITTSLREQNISAVGRSYTHFGMTPLYVAAASKKLDLVEWLITHGVYIDREIAELLVVNGSCLEVVSNLIEKGLDVKFLRKNGENLLFAAARGDDLPLQKFLIDKGFDVNSYGGTYFPAQGARGSETS